MQVWYATESGNLEVTYTHTEEHVCINLFIFPLECVDLMYGVSCPIRNVGIS